MLQTCLQNKTVLTIKNLLKTQLLKPITKKINFVLIQTRASGRNHKPTTTSEEVAPLLPDPPLTHSSLLRTVWYRFYLFCVKISKNKTLTKTIIALHFYPKTKEANWVWVTSWALVTSSSTGYRLSIDPNNKYYVWTIWANLATYNSFLGGFGGSCYPQRQSYWTF